MARWLAVSGLLLVLAASGGDDVMAKRRAAMVAEVSADFRMLATDTGVDSMSASTRQALSEVERHRYVPEQAVGLAYVNRPLPIGHGQTISQPLIVALMTELLQLQPDHRVLEVGTGSAYQAAVLARVVQQVYSIEIIEPLAIQAKERLADLGYTQVQTRGGDGYFGWPEEAPFDAIIVTAAAGHIPPPLIEQLKPGGRMVIPVGSAFHTQNLLLVEKAVDGEIRTRQVLPVVFVPLTGGH